MGLCDFRKVVFGVRNIERLPTCPTTVPLEKVGVNTPECVRLLVYPGPCVGSFGVALPRQMGNTWRPDVDSESPSIITEQPCDCCLMKGFCFRFFCWLGGLVFAFNDAQSAGSLKCDGRKPV